MRLPGFVLRRDCLLPVGVASPPDRAVVFDGPDVGDLYRDLGGEMVGYLLAGIASAAAASEGRATGD